MEDPIGEGIEHLGRGGLLAYPTETLWGLGADATSEAAVARLRAWKGREGVQPLSILVEGEGALARLGLRLPRAAHPLAGRFWPGPLTLVLPCVGKFAPGVAREGDGAVGVRCSAHPVAAALARRLAEVGAGPVTATSLNRSGRPPAVSADEAAALCGRGRDAPRLLAVPGAPAPRGGASTVVDATGPEPVVLREGSLGRKAIEACLSEREGA